MKSTRIKEQIGFYENELTNNLLHFWLPRCIDTVHGGYFNCFDNTGQHLLSHDKYTWSQGRFVWIFAKLAMMDSPTFTAKQKSEFLRLAKSGRDFLARHCLVGPDDWRCVFLMDEAGHPKTADNGSLDSSIYADCFVIAAFARYALAADDQASYTFCKNLYASVLDRLRSGLYKTHPYPLSRTYRAHGIPMILTNITKEVHLAAEQFAPDDCPALKDKLQIVCRDILDHFADENQIIHEVIRADNQLLPNLLGQHTNPGHSIECMWFLIEAADLLDQPQLVRQAAAITRATCAVG